MTIILHLLDDVACGTLPTSLLIFFSSIFGWQRDAPLVDNWAVDNVPKSIGNTDEVENEMLYRRHNFLVLPIVSSGILAVMARRVQCSVSAQHSYSPLVTTKFSY